MERRNALMSLSGILATSAFFGATAPRSLAQTPVTPTTHATLGASRYKTQTLAIGTFAKETSQLAMSKATHPKIKEFANFEVAEQTTIAQALMNMNNPPPAPLDAQQTAMLKQLQAQSGHGFEAAYVQGQLTGHRELLDIQQEFLNGTPPTADQQHIAMMARTVIQMHIVMLMDLQSELST